MPDLMLGGSVLVLDRHVPCVLDPRHHQRLPRPGRVGARPTSAWFADLLLIVVINALLIT